MTGSQNYAQNSPASGRGARAAGRPGRAGAPTAAALAPRQRSMGTTWTRCIRPDLHPCLRN
ncbi:hypothetical protein [Lysobacter gummosus]|uniref:hypothetical protein n=1 Tax=Lysobacter gummosus TaxID=262324 RepID=UPI00362A8C42